MTSKNEGKCINPVLPFYRGLYGKDFPNNVVRRYRMEKFFDFVIPDLPRTTTKQEYKAVNHWLRIARRHVHQLMDLKQLQKPLVDLAIYGKSTIRGVVK